MMLYTRIMVLVLLVVCVIEAKHKKKNRSIRKAIDKAIELFEENYRKGDVVALSEQYTEDGVFLFPGRATITGREDIQAAFIEMRETVKTFKFNIVEVIDLRHNRAFYRDTFEGKDENGTVVLSNARGVALWKKVKGTWLLEREMLNFSQ